MYEFTGKDTNGIARVYGSGETETQSVYECQEAAKDYVRRRPDTGPLSKWEIVRSNV